MHDERGPRKDPCQGGPLDLGRRRWRCDRRCSAASSSLDLGEARWKRQGLKGAEREESGRGIQNNGELPDGG